MSNHTDEAIRQIELCDFWNELVKPGTHVISRSGAVCGITAGTAVLRGDKAVVELVGVPGYVECDNWRMKG